MKSLRTLLHHSAVLFGGAVLTLACFLVLPVMQEIGEKDDDRREIVQMDTGTIEPPPPPPEEEPPEEEPEEEPPPELQESQQPKTLEDIALALNPTFGDGVGGRRIQIDISPGGAGGQGLEKLFSQSDLEQKPRPVFQPMPNMTDRMRRNAPATVVIIFIVNQQGRVEQAKIQGSADPLFAEPALKAVKRWKFDPGKRGGKPVSSRMRVPITFPKK